LDPLSDVLSLLKPRSYISAGLDAGGEWAIAFPAPDGIKFNAIVRGACWVSVAGGGEPHRLEAGDCFLLTQGRPFTLATDLSLAPIEAHTIYDTAADGIATCNGGGDFYLVGGRFAFLGDHADVLFGALPPVVHIRRASVQASVLRWSLDQLTIELGDGQPGGVLMAEHLAHIMLLQVLRLYLNARHGDGIGWFYALSDRQIGPVVGAMHSDPAHRWTLQELASLAGMSRSTFAQRFKQIVGTSPIGYLRRWRMLVAGERLRTTSENLASIAASLGYESESAFSTAFRRTMLNSPRQYQRSARR
jgi:AraC-like DNA-binding protein